MNILLETSAFFFSHQTCSDKLNPHVDGTHRSFGAALAVLGPPVTYCTLPCGSAAEGCMWRLAAPCMGLLKQHAQPPQGLHVGTGQAQALHHTRPLFPTRSLPEGWRPEGACLQAQAPGEFL